MQEIPMAIHYLNVCVFLARSAFCSAQSVRGHMLAFAVAEVKPETKVFWLNQSGKPGAHLP